MTENKADPLTQVFARFKHAIIGSDLYIGVEALPRGAWSVKVPDEGRAIFEAWLYDLEKARDALAAVQPAAPTELASSERLGPLYDGTRSITSSLTPDGGGVTPPTTQPSAPLGGREAVALTIQNFAASILAIEDDEIVNVGPFSFACADAILAAIPQERGVDRAAIIEECARRAQEIADSYRHNNGHVTHFTLVIEGVVKAIRALAGKETGR